MLYPHEIPKNTDNTPHQTNLTIEQIWRMRQETNYEKSRMENIHVVSENENSTEKDLGKIQKALNLLS
jgi:hypothetical protein